MKAIIIVPHEIDKNFADNFELYLDKDNGYRYLNLVGTILVYAKRAGIEVDCLTYKELNKNPKLLNGYDRIFANVIQPFNVVCKFTSPDLRHAIFDNIDKFVRIDMDLQNAMDDKAMASYPLDKMRKRLSSNFNISRMKIDSDEEMDNIVEFYDKLYKNTKCIINVFKEPNKDDAKTAFGEYVANNIIPLSDGVLFKKIEIDEIPFEERTSIPAICIGSAWRDVNKKLLKQYKLNDLARFGTTSKDITVNNRPFSENEVQLEYAKHKYVISPPTKTRGLLWHRTRMLYSAWHGSIILGVDPEMIDYPDCYKLDYTIFDKSIEEQKEIAKAQSEWILANRMTEEQALENFKGIFK